MSTNKDLVDLTVSVNISIGLSFGNVQPTEEQRRIRALQAQAVSSLKPLLEQQCIVEICEELGYDESTIRERMVARDAQIGELHKAEDDGRSEKNRQRKGLPEPTPAPEPRVGHNPDVPEVS